MNKNPYKSLPDHAFWRRSVSNADIDTFDPVTEVPFGISKSDKVATAGSCFAQHIARTLQREGFSYLVTEKGADASYGVFPARFGNIYTVRQLLQLFDRAYGVFSARDHYWKRRDGTYIDPFRPNITAEGFASPEALFADRDKHLAAVREMFETADVFVFTLGLTEAWRSRFDGTVYPFHPNAVGCARREELYEPVNFGVEEMARDLKRVIEKMRTINPSLRIILTVSPVPLIATHEDRHVLVSTIYSKSALRVVAEMVSNDLLAVAYFPSYEIITSPVAGAKLFAEDLREVRPEGVACVMQIFRKHFLTAGAKNNVASLQIARAERPAVDSNDEVICDEELLDI